MSSNIWLIGRNRSSSITVLFTSKICAQKTLAFEHMMHFVVSTVNFIKSRRLNHRQFQAIDADYGDLLYHNVGRWLSRGKDLKRFVVLLAEMKAFLIEKGRPVTPLDDAKWFCDLIFLTDLTAPSERSECLASRKGTICFWSRQPNHNI
ncbi:UNVERIFIED_CONTAM: hypothetical protein FKN15_054052 [Acipenser sinensis]